MEKRAEKEQIYRSRIISEFELNMQSQSVYENNTFEDDTRSSDSRNSLTRIIDTDEVLVKNEKKMHRKV